MKCLETTKFWDMKLDKLALKVISGWIMSFAKEMKQLFKNVIMIHLDNMLVVLKIVLNYIVQLEELNLITNI